MKSKLSLLFLSLTLTLVSCGSSPSRDDRETYLVKFFDKEDLLFTYKVKEGNKVEEPTAPKKEEYTFVNWCTDLSYQVAFDFNKEIYKDTSIYANYQPFNYFEDYNDHYLPNYSPLSTIDSYYEGDINPTFVLKAEDIKLNDTIPTNRILLHQAFKDLKVSSVQISDNTLTIKTTGTVLPGEGAISLARNTTDYKGFVTTTIPVIHKSIGVSPYGFRIDFENNTVLFSVQMENIALANPEELSPEDYLIKVLEGEYHYFTCDAPSGYEYKLTSIHDDFLGFDAYIKFEGEFDQNRLDEISNIAFKVAKEALDDEVERNFTVNLNEKFSKSNIVLSYLGKHNFTGEFEIDLYGCIFNENLKDHLNELVTEPLNQNTLIKIEGADVTLTNISIDASKILKGTINVVSNEEESRVATIDLSPIKLEEGEIVFTESYFKEAISLDIEKVDCTMGYDLEEVGTVIQNPSTTYQGVTSYIQDYTFSTDDDNDDLSTLMKKAASVGMIAYGLYSGDYTTAMYGLGELTGIDRLRNQGYVILEALQTIMDELKEIERRIDDISLQLHSIVDELRNIGQEALLSNFIDSFNRWNDFVTNYYTPLSNRMAAYVNSVYLYYYDLAMSSHPDTTAASPSITVYYDTEGNLAFPDRYGVHSVEGKTIDRSATKVINLPVLSHTIAGIKANKEHAYISMENDIIVDILASLDIDDNLLVDLVKTIRFNAMKNYFDSADKIIDFTNEFTNFCNGFTNNELGGISLTFTPLTSFTTMLETVFNFGFEVEPDINLAISKISATYYCARRIVEFTRYLNNGDVAPGKYDEIEESFKAELESPRFHHYNDEKGNIYSYAANAYIKFSCDAYGFIVNPWEGIQGGIRRSPDGHFDLNTPTIKTIESIDETTVALILVKAKVYNMVKKTNYSFPEYLFRNKMINAKQAQEVVGVLLSIDGITGVSDSLKLNYIEDYMTVTNLHLSGKIDTGGKDDFDDSWYDYNGWDGGVKGEAMSFDSGSKTYKGIMLFYLRHNTQGGEEYLAYTKHTGNYIYFKVNSDTYVGCYSFYVNFAPAEQ